MNTAVNNKKYTTRYPREHPDRFWSRVDQMTDNGCWEWLGAKLSSGYGTFGVAISGEKKLRTSLAHRVSYELLIGPIPTGLHIDHLCRNRSCVNPAHLEPVTSAENTRRGEAGAHFATKTHCPHGHVYSEENTRVYQGRRFCIACCNRRNAEWSAKHRP